MRGSYLLCNKRILFIIPNVRIFRHGYDILVYRMIARACLNNEVFFVYKRLVNLIHVATLNMYVYVYWKCNDPFTCKCFDCYFVRIINIFLKVNVR